MVVIRPSDIGMRTMILVAAGMALACLLLWLVPVVHRTLAVCIFTVVWVGVVVWNLRIGLSHGYSVSEELPIHLVLLLIPTALAWGIWWRGH